MISLFVWNDDSSRLGNFFLKANFLWLCKYLWRIGGEEVVKDSQKGEEGAREIYEQREWEVTQIFLVDIDIQFLKQKQKHVWV